MAKLINFLDGGGEMGALIRAHDWSATELGAPETWPQGLRTAVRLLLNSQHPMYIFWGPNGLCFYNDAYRQSLGQSLGAEQHPGSLGRPAAEVWTQTWDIIGPQLEQVMSGGGATWHENQLVPGARNGATEDVYWTYNYCPIDDPAAPSGVGGVLVVYVETTNQIKLTRALNVLSQQREHFQKMPGFVAFLEGPEHIYRYVNDAYLDIAGARSFVGKTIREVFPELDGQGVFEKLDEVYATGVPFTAKARPVQLSGEPDDRFIDILYHPVRNDAGGVTGIFVGGHDVTDRVRAQVALESLNARLSQKIELALANHARVETVLRQSQKMEAVGQLTDRLAHEFNNLLTGIGGSLERISEKLAAGDLQKISEYIQGAQEYVRRSTSLTQRLSAFSRQQELQPKPVDIDLMLDEMGELIQRTVGAAYTVDIVRSFKALTALVDQNHLENALLNLCINARDAMPNGGKITIELASAYLHGEAAAVQELEPGEYVLLRVIDRGVGMTKEVSQRAFEPFFTTKPLGHGTGLGLSMVYGFVRQSGGQAGINSDVNKGTTVYMYLPRYYQEAAEPAEDAAADELLVDGAGRTVMVIDDEELVRVLIVDMLRDCGFEVLEASDGNAGLRMLKTPVKIDLLLSDIGLPGGMNGRQFAEAAIALRPELQVLLITGYDKNAAIGDGLEPRMRIVTKPFTMQFLAGKIAEALPSHSPKQ